MKNIFWLIILLVILLRFISTKPDFKTGDKIRIKGTLSSEPTLSFGKAYFSLNNINVEVKEKEAIHYGDYVIVNGIWENGRIKNGEVESFIEKNNIFSLLRQRLLVFYAKFLTQPSASLVGGIVLGAKSDLPANFKQNLNSKGLSHIVVASGTNITILASFLVSVFIKRLSRKKTLILTIIFIWLYALISGLDAPIVRASTMSSIAFVGIIYGRIINTLKIVFLTGCIMLILSPQWLTDPGFLLSFATTISIILYQKKINNFLKKLPDVFKEDLSTSLAAQIGGIPIIYMFFGEFNLLSPFYNVLVLWTIPIIMFFGGVSALISLISGNIAYVFLIPIIPLLKYFIGIVNL